jgi:NAD(P)-dependent dehydrogenase (short-subunit alcohol dehydrogenase family)
MGKLDGKIALITGGSYGIGLGIAKRFLNEGAAHVYITGRGQDALDNAIKELDKKNVTAIQGDISKFEDLDRIYNQIKEEKNTLDILVANAAVIEIGKIGSITEEHFDYIFNVNCKGTLFTVQKALPIFKDGGSIILTGSLGSIKGRPDKSVYCASKAAIRSFARCWTVDLKERRIRVNVVSPGATETPGFDRIAGDTKEAREATTAQFTAVTPLQRIATADEVAKAVVFLASDDSSYITGIELFVDGGAGQI